MRAIDGPGTSTRARRHRRDTVSIGAMGAVALASALDIPHAISDHPLLGLGLVTMIAGAVVAIIAMAHGRRWRWRLVAAVASAGLALLIALR